MEKSVVANFGGEGGFVHMLASIVLFWQEDVQSCRNLNMSISDGDKLAMKGTFSLLWPIFVTICFSQFADTMASALQGRKSVNETGMTLFDHSLAFAECESMICDAIGLGYAGIIRHNSTADVNSSSSTNASQGLLLSRSQVLQRLNVPSEVLLICLVSCLSHISSSVLATCGKRNQYRLVNSAIWSICYMGAYSLSFSRAIQGVAGPGYEVGFIRFPLVCILGFLPHILIFAGMIMCGIVYSLALLITVLSPPPNAPHDLTIKQRISVAYRNLQANAHLSTMTSLRISWQDDFYTNLIKIGFNILTAASDAVYLNEGSLIKVDEMTWLERKRLSDLQATRRAQRPVISSLLLDGEIARGLETNDHYMGGKGTGFSLERKSKSIKRGVESAVLTEHGLGVSDRRTRWDLLSDYGSGVMMLLKRVFARLFLVILSSFGVNYNSERLQRWADHKPKNGQVATRNSHTFRTEGDLNTTTHANDLNQLFDQKRRDINVDIEQEARLRIRQSSYRVTEDMFDEKLYSWFKQGGWWGEIDSSGDFEPANIDDQADDYDDLTSVISATDTARSSDWEEDDGTITPTKSHPVSHTNRLQEIQSTLNSEFSRLLDPKSDDDREEARILARHLESDGTMTRSLYRRRLALDNARLFTGQSVNLQHMTKAQREAEEERQVEEFILNQRDKARNRKDNGQSWNTGAEGMGAGGPQCVVCQSSPRTIMVWPCGCLSICDDCRLGVATRNFANCLCCRTNVVAYSRLYVP